MPSYKNPRFPRQEHEQDYYLRSDVEEGTDYSLEPRLASSRTLGNSAPRSHPPLRASREEGRLRNLSFWQEEEAEEPYEMEEEEEEHYSPIRFIVVISVAIILAAMGWFLFRWVTSTSPASPPLITAPTEPYKVHPENPGGLVVPHQDKRVYDLLNPYEQPSPVERLLPSPEQPVYPPQAQRQSSPEPQPMQGYPPPDYTYQQPSSMARQQAPAYTSLPQGYVPAPPPGYAQPSYANTPSPTQSQLMPAQPLPQQPGLSVSPSYGIPAGADQRLSPPGPLSPAAVAPVMVPAPAMGPVYPEGTATVQQRTQKAPLQQRQGVMPPQRIGEIEHLMEEEATLEAATPLSPPVGNGYGNRERVPATYASTSPSYAGTQQGVPPQQASFQQGLSPYRGTAATTLQKPAGLGNTYRIQLATLFSKEQAMKEWTRLSKGPHKALFGGKLRAEIRQISLVDGSIAYSLLVGPFSNEARAKKFREQLRKEGIQGLVIPPA